MERKYTTIWYQTIDSTNSEARRRLEELDNLSVLSARCQTAGRGQRGNTWSARPGENLTFSIVLKFGDSILPPLESKDQFLISEALTLAIAEYLADLGVKETSIKWPNDIYCRDRKICGILIENSLLGNMLETCILGVGLNLNQTGFPPEVPNPTSVKLETGNAFNPNRELSQLIEYFDKRLQTLYTDDGRKTLLTDYLARLYRRNQVFEYINMKTDVRFFGKILGISENACLLVENAGTGRTEEFSFKEIRYVIDGREQV